ncbi:hypothetical protein GCM10027610_033790 [Dactylosporangium cerinum]
MPGPLVAGELARVRECLAEFRQEFYGCLTLRADALFELTDAILCAPGPVTSLPELSLAFVHRRGHGALYDGLAGGAVEVDRLRTALTGLNLPRDRDGRLWLAVDVTPWPRPDAECSLPLRERSYMCTGCGVVLDRDVNAAHNLAALAANPANTAGTADMGAVGVVSAGSGPVAGRGASRQSHSGGQEAKNRQPGTAPADQTGTVPSQDRATA